MKFFKNLSILGLSLTVASCMVVPPSGTDMSGTASVYSTSSVPSQPVIVQQPAQPVIIQQPEPSHQHKQWCHDRVSGEYLKVHPDSKKCYDWLQHKHQEREKHHLCVDKRTGQYVHGVPANSAECHKINHIGDNRPNPKQPQPPVAAPVKPAPTPVKPVIEPVKSQPTTSLCIDKRTNQPVNGVPANSLQCAKINR
jgi:hypothetical protein